MQQTVLDLQNVCEGADMDTVLALSLPAVRASYCIRPAFKEHARRPRTVAL